MILCKIHFSSLEINNIGKIFQKLILFWFYTWFWRYSYLFLTSIKFYPRKEILIKPINVRLDIYIFLTILKFDFVFQYLPFLSFYSLKTLNSISRQYFPCFQCFLFSIDSPVETPKSNKLFPIWLIFRKFNRSLGTRSETLDSIFITDANGPSISKEAKVYFFRKILINLLSLLSIMKSLLNCKSQYPLFLDMTSEVAKDNSFLMKKYLTSSCQSNSFKQIPIFKIEPSLLSLSLREMVLSFNIFDLEDFLFLSRLYLPNKGLDSPLIFVRNDQTIPLSLTAREQSALFCTKTKRKDELVKFGFKFVRKRILSDFSRAKSRKLTRPNKDSLKDLFRKEMLCSNSKISKVFYGVDLAKKQLPILRQSTQLIEKILHFLAHSYIKDQISYNIFQKNEAALDPGYSLQEYLRVFFANQHKNRLVLQDVLNSLKVFSEFFSQSQSG